MNLVGLTVEQATKELAKHGVTKVIVQNNFVHPVPNSSILVTQCKINNKTATLVVGSFKLKL